MGAISLYPTLMSLSGPKDSVRLTAKEHQIMEVFMRRKSMITPKEMLIEKSVDMMRNLMSIV